MLFYFTDNQHGLGDSVNNTPVGTCSIQILVKLLNMSILGSGVISGIGNDKSPEMPGTKILIWPQEVLYNLFNFVSFKLTDIQYKSFSHDLSKFFQTETTNECIVSPNIV